jgi:sugar lactone lactonase YvrE
MTLPLCVVPVPGPGAEDVLVTPDGRVWTGTADGAIHVHDPADGSTTTVTATGGRPLGLERLPDGRILVCDAHRGLLALDPVSGDLETLLTDVDGERLLFTNNAAVTADGTIWFSDSSRVWPIEEWRSDLIEHTCTGRLFRRTPDGEVTTAVDRLCFANGVALTNEADAVLVAETGTRTIRRVSLGADGSPRATTTWVQDLPGHPDNIALGSDGLVWVTVASPTDRALTLLQRSPRAVRGLVRRAPERFKPTPKRTVRVLGLDSDGRTVHDLDFDATHWHLATGVREHDGRVWLGSLVEPAIAVGEVPRLPPPGLPTA